MDINFQYMDTKRSSPESVFPAMETLLKARYADNQPTAIIACDDNALDFLLARRDSLFPSVPIVFCGINNFSPERLRGVHGITGVAEDFDLRSTIDMALRLQPGVRRIVSVSDGTPSSRANLERLRFLSSEYRQQGLSFEELADLPEAELRMRLAQLNPDSIVLHLNYFRSPEGKTYTPQESIRLVADAAPVPIYSCWAWYLGHGIVGGRLASGFTQGKAAAEMIARILEGTPADVIPILKDSPNAWMFDAKQLSRFNLDREKLPPDSVLINDYSGFFERHRSLVLGAGLVVLLLSGTILLLTMNILARRRAEYNLKESEQRYRALYEEATVGIIIFDEALQILEANPLLRRNLGYSDEELRGRVLTEFIHSDDLAQLPVQVGSLLQGNIVRTQRRMRRKDGVYLSFEISARRLGPGFIQGVYHDVTARVDAEQELQRAKEYAEATSRSKSTFLANMSHELRTPLTTTKGMLELLRAKSPREDQQRYIQHALDSCDSLTLLLSDILDLSRVEAGRIELQLEPFSLGELLASIRLNHGSAASKKGLRLDIRSQPDLSDRLVGDPVRLRQVLVNLVGNAVKYTDKGTVSLSVERLGALRQGEERLLFTVSDTGIGIPDELLPTMFEAFTQAETSNARKYQGAGLGLQIVKRLVQLMGGVLCVVSEQGRGTQVHLSLRLGLPQE
ncbi:sensor histidine kinase [Paucidesulfovibrio longus]|uniref:sensor histidine kinase n=1 Tax=Paucidesulfovibrio longus TaxID=889 RepID=UPI00138AB4E9|nr:ABC transporter substrate binding protein [Paucidesulfovibrio longus]